jgi:hypothetical protein
MPEYGGVALCVSQRARGAAEGPQSPARLRVVLNHLGWPLPDTFQIDDLFVPRSKAPSPHQPFLRFGASRNMRGVHVMLSEEYAFSNDHFPFPDLTNVVRAIHDSYGSNRML